MTAFVGIDLAFSKKKRLPVVLIREDLKPFPLKRLDLKPPRGSGNLGALDAQTVREFVLRTAEYLSDLQQQIGFSIDAVAIDAPRAFKRDNQNRRACEIEMDRRGISCFATPSRAEFDEIISKARLHLEKGGALSHLPHANQLWMLVGFELFEGKYN